MDDAADAEAGVPTSEIGLAATGAASAGAYTAGVLDLLFEAMDASEAALGGFLGFFHQDFRRHDYLLGRHNCRSLMRSYFAVPIDNPVVRHWACDGAGLRRRWRSA